MRVVTTDDPRVTQRVFDAAMAALGALDPDKRAAAVGVFFYPECGGDALLLETSFGALAVAREAMDRGHGVMAQGRINQQFHAQFFFRRTK